MRILLFNYVAIILIHISYTISFATDIENTQQALLTAKSAEISRTVNASYPTKSLIVKSINPANGVQIEISPPDINTLANGNTTFSRTYVQGTSVTLNAPGMAGGNNFNFWSGCDIVSSRQCTVIMTSDRSITANYYHDTVVTPLAQLPKTEQSMCYDSQGLQIDCAGTGQDGELQQGVAWPDPRLTDNQNGTITDNLTGLIWLKDANCFGQQNWATAVSSALSLANGACALTDGSSAGDWRLPNINEIESLINISQTYGNYSTWLTSVGFTNVGRTYWSSTTDAKDYWYAAWTADFLYGSIVTPGNTGFGWGVWPVRTAPSHGAIRLPKTGQTQSYAAGDDGALQSGVDICPRHVYRYETYSDRLTGLMWPKNANMMISRDPIYDQDYTGYSGSVNDGAVSWQHALDYIKKLNAEQYLGFSDWRLPNRRELMSMVNRGQADLPGWLLSIGFLNVQGADGGFWTSSYGGFNNWAWVQTFHNGNGEPYDDAKSAFYYVWPVRTGKIGEPGAMTDLSITGGPATVPINQSAKYEATATWSDGSTTPALPTWSVTPTTYASIDSHTGQLTASYYGSQIVTISASYTMCGITKTATKSVTITNDPAIVGITIIGPDVVSDNNTAVFNAVAWNSGAYSNVIPVWSVSPAMYASISSNGVLTTSDIPDNQSVTVTASYTSGGVTYTATRIVTIANQSVNISGRVKTTSGAGVAGITFIGATCSTSDSNGTYFCKAPIGWNGTITAAAGFYSILPVARNYVNVSLTLIGEDYLVVGPLFGDGFEGDGWATAWVSGSDTTWSIVSSGTIGSSGGYWTTVLPHGGAKMARFNSSNTLSGGQTRLYSTTGLNVPVNSNLKFWMYHDTGYPYLNDSLQVQISTDGTTWNNLGNAIPIRSGSVGWIQASIDLSVYTGQTIFLGFLGNGEGGNNIYLDDVTVEAVLPPISISGSVKAAGLGVAGVALSGATCTATDGAGFYICSVGPGWSGTITPLSTQYTFIPASRNFTGVSADLAGQDFVAGKTLSVTKLGTGNGTIITSSGSLIWVDSIGTETYALGTKVTLSEVPDSVSTFGGWSGPGTLSGTDYMVSMTDNRNVTATFTAAPKAKIGSTGYATLNAAYTAAASGATIMLLDTVLAENLLMNKGKALVFRGGYTADYTARTGNPTILNGLLSIGGTDSLTVDGVAVK